MNKKEEKIQEALGTLLQAAWREYLKTIDSIKNLQKEINRIQRIIRFIAKCNRLTVEAQLLCARTIQIQTHIEKVQIDARVNLLKIIKKIYGKDIVVRFINNYCCKLSNGITLKK
jgi:hypothetical protein